MALPTAATEEIAVVERAPQVRRQLTYVGLIGLAGLVPPVLLGSFRSFQAMQFLIFALTLLSLVVLTGWVGQISLMPATFLGIGSFLAYQFAGKAGLSFWLALPLTMLMTVPFTMAIGFPALRLRGLYLGIATLAFAGVIEQTFFRWEWFTGGPAGSRVPRPSFFGLSLDGDRGYYVAVLGVTVLVFWFTYNLSRSRIGRAFIAVRDNEPAAHAMGVNVIKYKMLGFALSGAYAGVAGALYASSLKSFTSGPFSLPFSIIIFSMAVIGGIRSMWGALLGSLFLTVTNELARESTSWGPLQQLLGAAGLVYFLAVSPGGLAAVLAKLGGRLRGKMDE